MAVSPAGRAVALEIIRRWEGLELQPYMSQEDEGLTVGWGHKITTTAERKKFADGITEDQAEALLLGDIAKAERAVGKIKGLNANQEGALVSLAFNIGSAAFSKSSAFRLASEGRHEQVPAAIKLWNKVTVNGRKVVSKGLKRRREHEAFVYARAVAPAPMPLMRSRTVAGSIASGGATIGGGVVEAAQEVVAETQGQLAELAPYLEIAKWLLIVVALIGLGLVVYARLSDRRAGDR